ncbi:MAG TPA: hypothetical protein VGD88_14360, partial [Opitutaceae bacterium]
MLWFGTDKGLSKFGGSGQFFNLPAESGVPGNSIRSIHDAGDDGMWLATQQGLLLYDPTVDASQAASNKCVAFTTKDGLPSDEI